MADLYELGDKPPLGEIPARMHAYLVRQNRFGQPRDAWKREVIPTPTIGPGEVLIYVRSWASPRTSTRGAATAPVSSGSRART